MEAVGSFSKASWGRTTDIPKVLEATHVAPTRLLEQLLYTSAKGFREISENFSIFLK
jgi:hypothetical protein